MSVKSKPFDLSSDNLIYVLNRCHKSLMRAYESQKHMADELLFVANLATTEKLVKEKITKQKINNNGE